MPNFTQGPFFPSSGTDQGGGSYAWANPGNITADGGGSAVANVSSGGHTNVLRGSGFGFSVPAVAVIDGILLEIRKSASASNKIEDTGVILVKAGVETGNIKNNGTWPIGSVYVPYGGAADLWGYQWLPADVNDVNFGADMTADFIPVVGNAFASVDAYRMTVFYHITTSFIGVNEVDT